MGLVCFVRFLGGSWEVRWLVGGGWMLAPFNRYRVTHTHASTRAYIFPHVHKPTPNVRVEEGVLVADVREDVRQPAAAL